MRKFLLAYLFSLITGLAFAQVDSLKIAGYIFSGITKLPVTNGKVSIGSKGTYIDSLGYFSISNLARGKYKFSFSSIDYEKKDTILNVTSNIEIFEWFIYSVCRKFNRQKALQDIKENQPLLLLQGGIAPIRYSGDKGFSKKYKIQFVDFGDLVEDYQDCITEYNWTIFDYLDKRFGKKWRKEIRQDIIGLN